MKIAYVTTYDAHDPGKWSGLGFHIARALENAGCELEYIGPLRERFTTYYRAKTLFCRKLKKQAFQRDREPAILDYYARQVEARLRTSDAQIVFSPGSVPVAHLKSDRPIVFWTDATYAALQRAYKWELPPTPASYRNGNAMEQRSIDNAKLAIYSSDWAADSAISDYHANPSKVRVVPFGANIDESRSIEEVRSFIASRDHEVCRLLFVGVGWERKGADIAIEATRLLNELGTRAELNLVGSLPPELSNLPNFIKPLGFINKTTAEGRARFETLFKTSHFLILPARAEAFGVVLCEANSFGLPCLATNVGGIPTIVRDGLNGKLFAPEDPRSIAIATQRIFTERAEYARLAESSFDEYQARLNWRVAGRTVRSLMESL